MKRSKLLLLALFVVPVVIACAGAIFFAFVILSMQFSSLP